LSERLPPVTGLTAFARRLPALVSRSATLSTSIVVAQESGPAFPQALDDYLANAVKQWEIPGAAIARR